ncbi:serine hydrolase FSH [Dactylonectria estremocensis]|uniref:Serine hydrolase FSH n=1 Tax=Dactylonectria estremocensis TaxID=1079267 RepID=A0A9P9ELK2_9HYPO|nr:serine hydrolase FSH [Dactylonectria estremocensis]
MHKILCLHGHGTSAAIFKSQTAAFRAKLDDSFIFDFVDAPYPSRGAPGINAIYKSDTYTWWPQPTSQAIRASHSWVADYAREHGGYDAVCCFSQGCSLAASMALYRAVDAATSHSKSSKPDEPLPFRAAIFICGGVPLPVLEHMGLEVPVRAHEINKRTGELLNGTARRLDDMAANVKLIPRGVGLWDAGKVDLMHDPLARPALSDVFGLDFTRFPASARIRIPTAHVYGSKDPRWPAGIQLAEFCDDRLEYDHGGGHDIPRSTEVSNQIAGMIRQLMSQIQIPTEEPKR